jgi:hypothetical protein
MGFNKIFLGEKVLHYHYEKGGASSVLKYLSKYDAYLSTDEFSRELISLVEWDNTRHRSWTKEEFLEKIDDLFSRENK